MKAYGGVEIFIGEKHISGKRYREQYSAFSTALHFR
jgi:hypothetical protein